jgi:hypothetical protein
VVRHGRTGRIGSYVYGAENKRVISGLISIYTRPVPGGPESGDQNPEPRIHSP